MKRLSAVAAILVLVMAPKLLLAEARVESNIVFGMYSGLALLMDIHYPDEPNGYGIVHVSGSGWARPLAYNAPPLTQQPHVQVEAGPLVAAGYTIFTVNHRAIPRFQFPDPIEDLQRAVRFVRFHADDFEIDPEHIGAMGGSSGGHLVALLGTLDGIGEPDDTDPINRVSAKVQCVVARAAPTDLSKLDGNARMLVGSGYSDDPGTEEHQRYLDASPVAHASFDDAPTLLIHGDEDKRIPFEQAGLLADALADAGVKTQVIRAEGVGHDYRATFEDPGRREAMIEWFDTYLKR